MKWLNNKKNRLFSPRCVFKIQVSYSSTCLVAYQLVWLKSVQNQSDLWFDVSVVWVCLHPLPRFSMQFCTGCWKKERIILCDATEYLKLKHQPAFLHVATILITDQRCVVLCFTMKQVLMRFVLNCPPVSVCIFSEPTLSIRAVPSPVFVNLSLFSAPVADILACCFLGRLTVRHKNARNIIVTQKAPLLEAFSSLEDFRNWNCSMTSIHDPLLP